MISNQSLTCPKGASLTFEIDMDTGSDLTGATAQWALCESWFDQAKVYLTKTGVGDGLFIGQDNGVWKITVNLAPTDTLDIPSGLLYHDCKVLLQSGDVEDIANGPFSLDPSVNILLTNAPITRNLHAVQLLGRLGQNAPLTVAWLPRNLLAAQNLVGLGQSAAAESGGVSPDFQIDLLSSTSLPSWLSFSRASNAMVTDSTGNLTYAPNNRVLYSNDFTNAVWTNEGLTVMPGVADPIGGTAASTLTATADGQRLFQSVAGGVDSGTTVIHSVWARRRTGTGTITLRSPANVETTITPTSSWQQFYLVNGLSGFGFYWVLTLATSGDAIDIYLAATSLLTYETAPRSADQVITISSAYYGPRFDHIPTYAPNNLILYSGDLTNTAWTALNGGVTGGVSDPDGSNNAFTFTATANTAQLYQPFASFPPGYAINSIWLRRRTGSGVVSFRAPDESDNNVTLTSTWQRFSIKSLATGAYNHLILFTSGDAVDIYHPQSEAVTYETLPRAYNPTTSSTYGVPLTIIGVANGLMDEEQRTNLIVYSTDLNNANWSKDSSGTITSSSRPAPDGTNTAFTFTAGGAGTGRIYQAYGSTAGQPYTNTIWIRRRTGTGVINVWNPAATTIDVTSQISGTWNRIPVTDTAAGSTFVLVQVMTAGDEVDIWGPQAELGPFATSYIPTTTAAVTRSADIVQLTGAALAAFQGAAYSVVMKITDTKPSFYANYLYLDDGAGVAADILRQHGNLTVDLNSNSAISGGTELSVLLGSDSTAGPLQIAFGTDASGRSIAGNGGSIASDANTPSRSPTAAYIGARADGSTFASDMRLAGIALYTSRLFDADLQAKSVVGAAF